MRIQWLALVGAAFGPLAAAGEPAASVEALYEQHCRDCHGAALQGSAHGPPLKGEAFLNRWGGARQALLTYNLATMPPGGSRLGESEHAALVDFLLADAETGHGDLQAGGEQSAVDSWSGVAGIDEIARSRSAFQNRRLEGFEPVSDARLRDPPPGDWLHWRRTQDGQAHSPLTQIGRANVDRLQLAWAATMREGSNQVTPLVHDGILYLTHPDNVVQALDGATGELIWEYAYDYPPAAKTLGGPLRNIAIHGDKLFLATYDAALVAIDARTGKPVWRTVKADYRQATPTPAARSSAAACCSAASTAASATKPMAASSPGTIPQRAGNCGAPPRSPCRATLARRPGAGWRRNSGPAAMSGSPAAMIRNSVSTTSALPKPSLGWPRAGG